MNGLIFIRVLSTDDLFELNFSKEFEYNVHLFDKTTIDYGITCATI